MSGSVVRPFEKAMKTDEADGTRAAQDQLAQQTAPKFQLVTEPTEAPAQQVTNAQVAASSAPTASPLELAVHALLDQLQTIGKAQAAAAAPEAGAGANELVALLTTVTPEALDAGAIKDLLASASQESTREDDKPDKKDAVPTLPLAEVMAKPEPNAAPSKGPTAVVAVRDPQPLPENPNPSHMHLVLDNDGERMVVTVAVRGNEVSATLRGGDEQTAASIARNAATLDHAMRARGLDLTNFTAERELGHDRRHHDAPEHEDKEETTVFRLEEMQ